MTELRDLASQVSIVVPVRNGERYLAAAIESILTQSVVPGEVVVVDDGSIDRSAAIAEAFGAPVRVERRTARGQFAATNDGISVARGRFLGSLDADDLWTPGSLASRLARLEAPDEPDGVFGRTVQFVSPELEEAMQGRYRFDPTPTAARLFQTTLMRRSVWDRVGVLDATRATSANIDWMARADEAGVRFVEIDAVVARRRIHDTNVSLTRGKEKSSDLLEVVRSHRRRLARPDDPGGDRPCT